MAQAALPPDPRLRVASFFETLGESFPEGLYGLSSIFPLFQRYVPSVAMETMLQQLEIASLKSYNVRSVMAGDQRVLQIWKKTTQQPPINFPTAIYNPAHFDLLFSQKLTQEDDASSAKRPAISLDSVDSRVVPSQWHMDLRDLGKEPIWGTKIWGNLEATKQSLNWLVCRFLNIRVFCVFDRSPGTRAQTSLMALHAAFTDWLHSPGVREMFGLPADGLEIGPMALLAPTQTYCNAAQRTLPHVTVSQVDLTSNDFVVSGLALRYTLPSLPSEPPAPAAPPPPPSTTSARVDHSRPVPDAAATPATPLLEPTVDPRTLLMTPSTYLTEFPGLNDDERV